MLPSQPKRNCPRIPIPGSISPFSCYYIRTPVSHCTHPCLPVYLRPYFRCSFLPSPNTKLSNNPTLWSPIHEIFACTNVSAHGVVKTRGGKGGGVHTPAAGTLCPAPHILRKNQTRLTRLSRLRSPTISLHSHQEVAFHSPIVNVQFSPSTPARPPRPTLSLALAGDPTPFFLLELPTPKSDLPYLPSRIS